MKRLIIFLAMWVGFLIYCGVRGYNRGEKLGMEPRW
jgi:hypothetical protein